MEKLQMSDIYKLDPDFLKTLERMYKDSRILYEKGEYYNCCYLCGYILECALKYILLKFGRDENGLPFSVNQVKRYGHKTQTLNEQLDNCISSVNGIPPRYRLDCEKHAPYMLHGKGGHKVWDPGYRYGEHPMWEKKEYCDHYMSESEYIFRFIGEIVV